MSARAATKPLAGLVLGGEPRVNLLPPEVGERARQRGVRARLGGVVVLSALLVAVGYGYAWWQTALAEGVLATEQARSNALLNEQLTYTEASAMKGLVDSTVLAQQVAVSGEVVWADIVAELGTAADGIPVTLVEYTAEGRAPWQAYLTPSGVLRAPRAASISLVFASASPVDVTAFQRRIDALDIVADSSIDTVQYLPGGYRTTLMVNLDMLALTDRYPASEGDTP